MVVSPDSGFDTQSDLLLATPHVQWLAVYERSVIRITRKRREAIEIKMPTTPGDKIGDAA